MTHATRGADVVRGGPTMTIRGIRVATRRRARRARGSLSASALLLCGDGKLFSHIDHGAQVFALGRGQQPRRDRRRRRRLDGGPATAEDASAHARRGGENGGNPTRATCCLTHCSRCVRCVAHMSPRGSHVAGIRPEGVHSEAAGPAACARRPSESTRQRAYRRALLRPGERRVHIVGGGARHARDDRRDE